jgi:hypothetical protein
MTWEPSEATAGNGLRCPSSSHPCARSHHISSPRSSMSARSTATCSSLLLWMWGWLRNSFNHRSSNLVIKVLQHVRSASSIHCGMGNAWSAHSRPFKRCLLPSASPANKQHPHHGQHNGAIYKNVEILTGMAPMPQRPPSQRQEWAG